MKRGTPDCGKMFELAERLNIPRLMAVGLMECLWHVAAKNTPRGDIGVYSDSAIAKLIGWEKKPAELVEALIAARWLDRDDTHRLVIHDWSEHCENSVHALLKKRNQSFVDGSKSFNRKSQTVHELVSNETSTTREAKAKAKALGSEVLNTSQVENLSMRADAENGKSETPAKPSVDSPGMTWQPPKSSIAPPDPEADARAAWAEQVYFRHPKQANKHASILALCRLYDLPADRALFECHHGAWIEHWAREGEKFTPPIVKPDGSGFLPDGAWRKPPPRPPKVEEKLSESLRALRAVKV